MTKEKTKYKVQSTKYKVQSTKDKVQGTKEKGQRRMDNSQQTMDNRQLPKSCFAQKVTTSDYRKKKFNESYFLMIYKGCFFKEYWLIQVT